MKELLIIFICFLFVNILYTQTIKYTYDSQNRIKTVLFPNGNTETYYYDKVGNRINQINVVNNTPTAINENINLFEDFKVYPNPTDGLFNINNKTNKKPQL